MFIIEKKTLDKNYLRIFFMQFNDLTPLPQTFSSLIKACDSFTLIIGGGGRDKITQFCKICKGFCQIL